MTLHFILAVGEKGELGYNGGLPWRYLSEDMKMFRELTLNQIVIMGRKTWEGVGFFEKRVNIVVSRSENVKPDKISSYIHFSSIRKNL